jgi:hypothetical protein
MPTEIRNIRHMPVSAAHGTADPFVLLKICSAELATSVMKPTDRFSPKNRIDPATLRVIHTSRDGLWSIAIFNWWDETNKWIEVVGMCWNGDPNNPSDVGYPNSRQSGTWFIVPDALAPHVRAFAQSMAIFAAT